MKTETPQTENVPAVVQPPLVRPLRVGAKVWLNDGTSQIITQIINEEAIGDNLYYRWSLYGEIEHAAMDPEKHSIAMVDWPNAEVSRGDGSASQLPHKS